MSCMRASSWSRNWTLTKSSGQSLGSWSGYFDGGSTLSTPHVCGDLPPAEAAAIRNQTSQVGMRQGRELEAEVRRA